MLECGLTDILLCSKDYANKLVEFVVHVNDNAEDYYTFAEAKYEYDINTLNYIKLPTKVVSKFKSLKYGTDIYKHCKIVGRNSGEQIKNEIFRTANHSYIIDLTEIKYKGDDEYYNNIGSKVSTPDLSYAMFDDERVDYIDWHDWSIEVDPLFSSAVLVLDIEGFLNDESLVCTE